MTKDCLSELSGVMLIETCHNYTASGSQSSTWTIFFNKSFETKIFVEFFQTFCERSTKTRFADGAAKITGN